MSTYGVEQAWEKFRRALIGDASPEEIAYWTGTTEPGDSFSSVSTKRAFEAGWNACFAAMCPVETECMSQETKEKT